MIDSINHKTDQLEQLLEMVEQHRKKLLTQLSQSKHVEEQILNKNIQI